METEPKDLGAVFVGETLKFEVLEHVPGCVKLRNIVEPEQYVLIDFEALRPIASILNRVAGDVDLHGRR